MPPDVAAVVNLHREGLGALPSIISAWRAVEHARSSGIDCSLTLVLDRADTPTSSLADEWRRRGVEIIVSEHGDLGLSRNLAVSSVDSTWVAFLDGDDLWGEHWLAKAHEAGENEGETDEPTAWHPALNFIFGDHHSVVHHVDSTDDTFSWSRLRLHNQWTALCFARRDLLAHLPYPSNNLERGFGFEDWSWNIEVLRLGGRHRVVPETCHFIHRSLEPSLLHQSQDALRTPYPRNPSAAHIARPPEQPALARTAGTHETAPLTVDSEIRHQIRLAATISPEIIDTFDPRASTVLLPQNRQTHVTERHLALDSFESIRRRSTPDSSVGELLELCEPVAALGPTDRTAVVAEVILDPELDTRERGTSPLIDEAVARYPQLDTYTGPGVTST
ncbi:MAG: glycosyltransferase family A protein [Acidimicrobiia bacterium]|nr:glycosyltransferase family A protein [Acidimicrobiia bacterium]